mgnify:FL=1
MVQQGGTGKRIAVVGAGISGICTAYLLQKQHRVTLFEKNEYFGGHTHTVAVPDGPDEGTFVDTGFIVLNERTYPNLLRFFHRLGVAVEPTDMSFSYYCPETGVCFGSRNLNALFARRINLFNPVYWRFVYEIPRFLKGLRARYLEGKLEDITLEEYMAGHGYHRQLAEWFVVPMAAAIWSASDFTIRQFPVRTFAQFYENHGLLGVTDHPPWYFVKGGSHSYVKAFLNEFTGEAVKNCVVHNIQRESNRVRIRFDSRGDEYFDAVVMAAHADEALAMLEDPDDKEKRLLGAWSYSRNPTVLHTDVSVMPPLKAAWSSWNYTRQKKSGEMSPVTVSYDMNRLQKIRSRKPLFVSLNPVHDIPPEHRIKEMVYTHPQYSFEAFATQEELPGLNGRRNTYFCGSYFGYGFHEDGVNAALSVTRHFGVEL